jgi:molybdenum cofactor cytidylyltransferase
MGFPKALLRYREETFLDRLAGLFAARCSPVVVVLGAQAERIRAGVHSAATFVVNPEWARGQTTSMQCGLGALPAEADGVLFTLVDHPAVAATTIDALLAGPHATLLRVPRFDGRRGHPIWFSRELIPEFLALPQTGAARDVVRGHATETEFLDVDDAGILADIDDPAAYRGLSGAGA